MESKIQSAKKWFESLEENELLDLVDKYYPENNGIDYIDDEQLFDIWFTEVGSIEEKITEAKLEGLDKKRKANCLQVCEKLVRDFMSIELENPFSSLNKDILTNEYFSEAYPTDYGRSCLIATGATILLYKWDIDNKTENPSLNAPYSDCLAFSVDGIFAYKISQKDLSSAIISSHRHDRACIRFYVKMMNCIEIPKSLVLRSKYNR